MKDGQGWKARLTEARERAGMKKVQLARMLGVCPASITDWEGPKVAMLDGETLVRIAEILHVTPEWIVKGVGDGADNSNAVVAEFAWLYRKLPEEGRAFLRNTIKVVETTYLEQENHKHRMDMAK